MEQNVTLRVRQMDVSLVESFIDEVQEIYKNISKKEVVIKVDQDNFLPAESCGGVDLIAARGNFNLRIIMCRIYWGLIKVFFRPYQDRQHHGGTVRIDCPAIGPRNTVSLVRA